MRLAISLAILLAPVAASAGPQCVLPTEPASAALPREAGVAPVAVPKQTGLHLISPDQIERSAALRRITAQGAEAFDIGTSHGLRGVFARKGDTFQVFYITPDNQAVIGGVMWDGTGHNITRDQVAPIDGAIPTVTIGDVPGETAAQTPQADTVSRADVAVALGSITAGKFGTEDCAASNGLYRPAVQLFCACDGPAPVVCRRRTCSTRCRADLGAGLRRSRAKHDRCQGDAELTAFRDGLCLDLEQADRCGRPRLDRQPCRQHAGGRSNRPSRNADVPLEDGIRKRRTGRWAAW